MIRITRSSKRLKGSVEEENHAKNQPSNNIAKRAKIVTENEDEKKSAGQIRGAATKSKVIGQEGKIERLTLIQKQKKDLNCTGESPAHKINKIKNDSDLDKQLKLSKVKSKAVRNNNENNRKFGKDIKNVAVADLPHQSETSAAKNIDFSISSITGVDRFKLTTSTPVVLLKRLERDLFNTREQLDLPDFPQLLSPVLSEEQRTMSIKTAGSDKCILNFNEIEENKADDKKSSKYGVKLKSNTLMKPQLKLSKEMVGRTDPKSCSNSKKPDKLFSDNDDDFQGAQNNFTKKTYMKAENVLEKKKIEGNVVQGNKSFKLFDMEVESSKNDKKETKKEVRTKKQKDIIKKADNKIKVQDKLSLKPTGDPPASGRTTNKQTKSNARENDWLPQTRKRMEEINYIDENYSLIIE